jgi:hypothetical protein
MSRDLVRRVVISCAALLVPLSIAGALLAGRAALLGILVGGGVTLGNLLWLSYGSGRVSGLSRGRPLWFLSLGLRYLALFAALALCLWSGWVHPLALIVGLSVLPPVLIIQGLRVARRSW